MSRSERRQRTFAETSCSTGEVQVVLRDSNSPHGSWNVEGQRTIEAEALGGFEQNLGLEMLGRELREDRVATESNGTGEGSAASLPPGWRREVPELNAPLPARNANFRLGHYRSLFEEGGGGDQFEQAGGGGVLRADGRLAAIPSVALHREDMTRLCVGHYDGSGHGTGSGEQACSGSLQFWIDR